MAPAEVQTVLTGAATRLKREHNERAWLGWHIAFMTAYAPEKASKFFKLKNLLWGEKEPTVRRPQDWRASLAAFSAWARSTRK